MGGEWPKVVSPDAARLTDTAGNDVGRMQGGTMTRAHEMLRKGKQGQEEM